MCHMTQLLSAKRGGVETGLLLMKDLGFLGSYWKTKS